MRNIQYKNYPNGCERACTFSFDDGHENDMRLAGLLDGFGMKATFNLNTFRMNTERYLASAEIAELARRGHEIAAHAYTHAYLEKLSPELVNREIFEDRAFLESCAGGVVNGFAYPFGTFSEQVKEALRSNGILYARTAASTGMFSVPKDWLEWNPTCHQTGAEKLTDAFASVPGYEMPLFYVWGHSFELNCEAFWGDMERILSKIAKVPGVWYATNREVCRYAESLKKLEWSTAGDTVFNPSALTLWVTVDGRECEIRPGRNEI